MHMCVCMLVGYGCMYVCIDVSLFGHPKLHGIRMETGYVITEKGAEPLSPYIEKEILKWLNI